MKRFLNSCRRAIALIVCLLPLILHGQVIIDELHLPAEMCAGSSLTASFGRLWTNTVVVREQEASLGHSELIFLPDGVSCNGSCSYRSPVTFDIFDDTAHIFSVENIKFVRLNIEHSYIGDIYINITCPNGQKADLMRFAGTGTSSCDGIIPQDSRQWLSGSNMMESNFFGAANDNENPNYPCNAAANGNQPGRGWNYCWSNNTTSGYQYASGDGIIYRNGHENNGRVDSSNVAAHTNFYHPDDNFNSLVGCPLNGTWYIEVVDGYSMDNGYIFEWELALDASLIPTNCYPVYYDVEGGTSTRLTDSTFRIDAPVDISADSTVEYRFWLLTSCGDTVDTSASIIFHPNLESSRTDSICQGDGVMVGTQWVTEEGHHDLTLNTVYGCDSVVHMDVTVFPTYDLHFEDSVCINVPYIFDGQGFTESGDHTLRYQTVDGCDSIRTLHLGITSRNLHAAIQAAPLIVNEELSTIRLKDVSRNHVGSRWFIDGMVYENQPSMTIDYPVDYDSLPISLEAVSREGCYDTATVVARYDRTRIFVPNAFTPNMGSNETWRPVVKDVIEMEVWIYNRQGILVAHLEGLDAEWDGGDWPTGAYVYTIHYRSRVRPDWKQVMTGTVTMIK